LAKCVDFSYDFMTGNTRKGDAREDAIDRGHV
jgi:hypothetical protein